jgi:hypothetical protein
MRSRNRWRLLGDDRLGYRLRRRLCCSFAHHPVALYILPEDRDDVAALGTLEPDPFPGDLFICNAEKLAARLTACIHDK